MNLVIKHRPGKTNTNADTLSRIPNVTTDPHLQESSCPQTESSFVCACKVNCESSVCPSDEMADEGQSVAYKQGDSSNESVSHEQSDLSIEGERDSIVCLTHSCLVSVPTGGSDEEDTSTISQLQKEDKELAPMLLYLTENELPSDRKEAIRIVAESSRFTVLDDILHYDSSDASGRVRVVVPESMREELLREAHDGCFAGHFAEKWTYELLKQQYWWRTMRADVETLQSLSCLCITRWPRKGIETSPSANPSEWPV